MLSTFPLHRVFQFAVAVAVLVGMGKVDDGNAETNEIAEGTIGSKNWSVITLFIVDLMHHTLAVELRWNLDDDLPLLS